jgi:hypothetical protein
MFKCKLCGAEAEHLFLPKCDLYRCSDVHCELNKVTLYANQWQLLNADWVTISDDPASLPNNNGNTVLLKCMLMDKEYELTGFLASTGKWYSPSGVYMQDIYDVIAWQPISEYK